MFRESIGKTICARRRNLKLTQAQAAVASGISQQHFSLIETGAVEAGLRTLRRISAALGLELTVALSRSPVQARLAGWARFNAWERGEAPVGAAEALRLSEEMARLFPSLPNEDLAERAGAWKRWRTDLARVRS